jgi:ABC-type uncharacterized transport system permease subunit
VSTQAPPQPTLGAPGPAGVSAAAPWRNLPALGAIVRGRLQVAAAYRLNTLFLLAGSVLQIFILRRIWTALYAGTATVDGLSLHAMLVYLTIANLQTWVLQDQTVSRYLYRRVRDGQVVFDVTRPVGFVPQMLAHLAGANLANTLVALIALPFAAFVGALGSPASAQAFGLYLVSLCGGYAITSLLTLLVGMAAFWSPETSGFALLYTLIFQFFAGALVPVPLFPGVLRIIADALPFQAAAYSPVAIYVGSSDGAAALRAIGIQGIWIVVLAAVTRLVWRAAARRLVVQGG